MQTLLVNPPFTKSEWSKITVSETITNSRFIKYFSTYAKAVSLSDKTRISKIIGQTNDEALDVKKLAAAIEKYAEDESHDLNYLENLLHLIAFVDVLKQKYGIKFEGTIEELTGSLHLRAVLELVHWSYNFNR
jgi:hypothetical protein